MLLGNDGKPIRVAEAVFTEDEFDSLGAALDKRMKNQPPRQQGGATKFLGVLICADCDSNMIVQVNRNNFGVYEYLRCQKCKSGGRGAPHPMAVYERLVADVLSILGEEPVQTREYAKGAEARKETERLEGSIAYYMRELEPGGRYAKTRFTKEQAEKTLDKLIADLESIDPETTKDRWVKVHNDKTFRDRWQEGGMEAMSADLLRVGVKCKITRTKVKGVRAPHIHMKLMIPKDVRDRLILKEDDFAKVF